MEPGSRSLARSSKKKEIVPLEVINLDDDEDDNDVFIIGGTTDQLNKGKAVMDYSHGYDHLKDATKGNEFSCRADGVEIIGSIKPVQNEGASAPSEFDLKINDLCTYDDDAMEWECPDLAFTEEYVVEYVKLQSHLDSMDIPTGVEVSIPWWADIYQGNYLFSAGSTTSDSNPKTSTLHSASVNSTQPEKKVDLTSRSGSYSQTGSSVHPLDVDISIQSSLTPSGHDKKSRVSSPNKLVNERFPSGSGSVKARHLLEPFPNKKINTGSSSSGKLSYGKSSNDMKMPFGADPLKNGGGTLGAGSVPHDFSGSYKSLLLGAGSVPHKYKGPLLPKKVSFTAFPATPIMNAEWQGPSNDSLSQHPISYGIYQDYIEPFDSSVHEISKEEVGSVLGEVSKNEDELMRKFQLFKQFDTVPELSDHHFSKKGTTTKHQSNKWLKRIQEEWKILEKDLPDTIFVRAYETRMDLLRAVIVGAEGTPYHDGLFFFDIHFPSDYPSGPPHVHYHSGGLRINPNLYGCGKVCLSLLNTWTGHNKNEKWIPGTSTMLQVLVSIQGLILNEKPYFNEPGYEYKMGTPEGERTALKYNEDTYILSLKTMLYTMKRPPEHFKDFVIGHFWKQAHGIIAACLAYTRGAQVGSLGRCSTTQKVKEGGGNSCSTKFKGTVASFIGLLKEAFSQIGVKDCERYTVTPDRAVPVLGK
ncbi:hypothetical protein MLD38_035203 [Melastoma candidum]|uniref:Uncharacterized protein n=1 Tax=Melastoma candidum TaxID=119954 RepID=A0ACB9ME46_9MYRT|nr:hypothetical protein MLD38_035203 [Melastoma candidum]